MGVTAGYVYKLIESETKPCSRRRSLRRRRTGTIISGRRTQAQCALPVSGIPREPLSCRHRHQHEHADRIRHLCGRDGWVHSITFEAALWLAAHSQAQGRVLHVVRASAGIPKRSSTRTGRSLPRAATASGMRNGARTKCRSEGRDRRDFGQLGRRPPHIHSRCGTGFQSRESGPVENLRRRTASRLNRMSCASCRSTSRRR